MRRYTGRTRLVEEIQLGNLPPGPYLRAIYEIVEGSRGEENFDTGRTSEWIRVDPAMMQMLVVMPRAFILTGISP
jgi:hypothetical protein